jgi:hypothetical protein
MAFPTLRRKERREKERKKMQTLFLAEQVEASRADYALGTRVHGTRARIQS